VSVVTLRLVVLLLACMGIVFLYFVSYFSLLVHWIFLGLVVYIFNVAPWLLSCLSCYDGMILDEGIIVCPDG
jgi:hypothetical protein